MSTRSNVVVMEGKSQLVRIYRQWDGYPSGIGNDIKSILNKGEAKLVNGYQLGDKTPAVFNGMGCLAAYLISKLKEGIGGVYIDGRRKLTEKDFDIEYEYILSETKGELRLKVLAGRKQVLYDGALKAFDGETVEKKGA